MPIYKESPVKPTNTSVSCVEGRPAFGWTCQNPLAGSAPRQAGSPITSPSSAGTVSSSLACITGRGVSEPCAAESKLHDSNTHAAALQTTLQIKDAFKFSP